MKNEAFLVGRLIVGIFYLQSAFHHFSGLGQLAGYAGSKGVPAPTLAVAVSGILLAIGGVTFLLGIWPRIGVLALVLFFLPVTFTMHAFWAESTQMARTMQQVNFFKNLALLGSTLMFLAIPEPWPYSVARRREHQRTQAHAPA
jgi:uncharacterized membrane protein YphA (DoxX/SURF4 family)